MEPNTAEKLFIFRSQIKKKSQVFL